MCATAIAGSLGTWEFLTYVASLSLAQVLTGIATCTGVLTVVVLAIAPGLFELWEQRVERHSTRVVERSPQRTAIPTRRDHYHRAA